MSDMLQLRLRELRKDRGYKQREVADRLYLPLRTYQNYERGVNSPDIAMVCDMADLYGVSVDYLVGHETMQDGEVPQNLVSLDADEKTLIDTYRRCNAHGMAALLALSEVFAQSRRYGA